jgi:uncharacterized membrane protein YsdA (DUF1294 family)
MARGDTKSATTIWLAVVALIVEVGLLVFTKLGLPMIALAHVAFFSVVAFVAFGWDKWCATRGARRVSEVTLLAIAVLGGALGALGAMLSVRHKTRRPLFWSAVCTALFVHVTLVGWLFVSR